MKNNNKEREALLPFELANEFLDYNPEIGVLVWKVRDRKHFNNDRNCNMWNTRYSNTVAGCTRDDKYRMIRVNCERYYAHRLAWLLHYGAWPENEIDHINNDPADNKIENLREATHAQNQRNMSSHKDSSSKYLGVSWDKKANKWQAKIQVDGTQYYLGYFTIEEDAARAYDRAAIKRFGIYANLNFPIEDYI
jgi:hypothetical protein